MYIFEKEKRISVNNACLMVGYVSVYKYEMTLDGKVKMKYG